MASECSCNMRGRSCSRDLTLEVDFRTPSSETRLLQIDIRGSVMSAMGSDLGERQRGGEARRIL